MTKSHFKQKVKILATWYKAGLCYSHLVGLELEYTGNGYIGFKVKALDGKWINAVHFNYEHVITDGI